jgi:hypothetical protein
MATEETKELIRANHYILVLDEVIDLFQPLQMDGGDINLLVRNNIAQKDGDNVVWKDEEYTGSAFSELMQMSKSRNLVDYDGEFFFWALPPDVFKCFDDAYVLTYLFEYQFQKYYFEINNIEYELIGTKKHNGVYQFCPLEEMNRKRDLRDKVHIIENEKYNEIGNKAFSLSSSWFERSCREEGKPSIMRLKNNLYNVFRKADGDDKLWTTLNAYRHELRGKGYSSCFITFNKRATNEFSNRHYLAYCINVFMMPWMKNYLARIGVESKQISQDMYALSVLIQWLFRSAIRNDEEIWLYIPSKRMRYLLKEWLKNLAVGEDLREIKFSGRYNRGEKTVLIKKVKDKEREKNENL